MMHYTASAFGLLGMVAFGAGPVMAQPTPSSPANGAPSYGYTPPPGTPVTPDDQGRQGAVPPVGQQIQAARTLRTDNPNRQPSDLLRQADRALKQRKVAVANELLERAQTAVLNVSQPGGSAPDKMTSDISAARASVVAGNMAEAHQHIADALGSMPPVSHPAHHGRRQGSS